MFRFLRQLLETINPRIFNCMSGGTLCGVSDLLAQTIEAGRIAARQHSSTTTTTTDDDNNNNHMNKNRRIRKIWNPTSFLLIGPSSSSSSSSSSTTTPTSHRRHFQTDYQRLFVASLLGMAFTGFFFPFTYATLDAIWVGRDIRTLITKSMVEIATVGVTANTISMTCRGLLMVSSTTSKEEEEQQQRRLLSTKDVLTHVWGELPKVTLNDVRVWLPYNLVAFSMIPPSVRPTTTALVEASWQTYISLRSNDYHHHHHHHDATKGSSFHHKKQEEEKQKERKKI